MPQGSVTEMRGTDTRAKAEVLALSAFLKQLFALLETSLTRYAVRCHRDKGAVSRYLSGQRVPPQDFVDDLLCHVTEITGQPVTAEVQEQAHRLRLEALRVSNGSAYELELLRQRLRTAEEELHHAKVRERVLVKAVADQEARAARAEQRHRQLERGWSDRAAQTAPGIGTALTGSGTSVGADDELAALHAELASMKVELERAQRLKQESEQDCLRLEAQLLAAEARLQSRASDGPVAELESRYAGLLRAAGRVVGTSLNLRQTAEEICDLMVPAVADLACVDLPEAGDVLATTASMRRLACRFGPEMSSWQHLLHEEQRIPLNVWDSVGSRLYQDEPVVIRRISPTVDAECAALLGDGSTAPWFANCSLMAVPLTVRGGFIGLLLLARSPDHQPFEEADALSLRALTDIAARSIETAQQHRNEVLASLSLQRSMLPESPPELAGARIAFGYQPSDEHIHVGGDWFDAVPLPGGRVALVIGDVMGHGLHSAAAMGRFRSAMQTLTALDLAPADVLIQLDDLCLRLNDQALTTCLYVVYDPVARTCTAANAGHLPPLLIAPDGDVVFVDVPPGPPIGAGAWPFDTVTFSVADGSRLVFYTNGLVFAEHRDITEGLDRLHAVAASCDPEPQAVCDRLLAELAPDYLRDDVALVAARLDGIPEEDVRGWTLRSQASEVRRARALVAGELTRWGLDMLVHTARLLVSETTTAALEQCPETIDLRVMRLRSTVVVEVVHDRRGADAQSHLGAGDDAIRRSGILAMSKSWGVARRSTGHVLWFDLFIPTEGS
ncbi:ATP-binding SpoIIE family protein phosphatase [Peterkaempfera bronchialis]|uniref:protein-serine/threonine phosphatase n=1 Tax=Peterkaempfera bronchialis TaxID=2126346 RepID=A0A345SSW1_9ACTN|nr:PP2C family protein-serine/threonine phosphatase [Peterkaempfera bronchialis]AXI76816.1 hypothetical protein C7M71_004430 [Peterkaempfera bronchialis]